MKKYLLFALLFFPLFSCSNPENSIINELKVDYVKNPLAVASEQPCFSWLMNSTEKDLLQTAYRIQVRRGNTLVWESDKVETQECVSIKYAGEKLIPFAHYDWNVIVWDNKGREHKSADAFFETGPVNSSDWKAKWIGMPADKQEEYDYKMNEVQWIWYPEDLTNPKGDRYFKTNITIKDLGNVEKTSLVLTGDDTCSLSINGQLAVESKYLVIKHFDVLKFLKEGDNTVEIKASNKWGGAGIITQLYVKYKNGEIKYFSTGKDWMASKDNRSWKKALDIGLFGKADGLQWFNEYSMVAEEIKSPSYLRKEFQMESKIKSARLYATALGVYELYLNGEKVSRNRMAPGWTDYRKRINYQAYDVTDLLDKGKNTISAILADGWYAGTIGWGHKRNNYGTYPLWLLAEIHIEYKNDEKIIVATDNSWKASFGPITASDMLDGEVYDAQKEIQGWNENGFADKDWMKVMLRSVEEKIVADPGSAVVFTDTLLPVKMFEPKKGVYIFDMAQNMVGVTELSVKGNKGDTIRMRFAEMLNPDSTMYITNLRSAKATDLFILKGKGTEKFIPAFTFHGFRYVEITGLKQKPALNTIKGLVMQSETPRTGYFECSDELLNKIYHNAFWGQKGNYLSVPTDCPQRDERLGWMGDALVFTPAACFNMDVSAFFNKWLQDIVDAQAEDGGFSDVSPRLIATGNGAPAWGDAGIMVPWAVYNHYNNTAVIEKHYDAFVKWIDYIWTNNPDYIWKNKCGANYGDWLNTNADMNRDVMATAFWANSVNTLSKIAATLQKTDDAKKYAILFENIKKAFNKSYVSSDGKIKNNTQTCYVLALSFDLLPEAMNAKAAKHLVENIKSHNWHHTTGFLGIGNLMQVLSDHGYPEVAYRLMQNNTFPSLGYMVVNGATTIWERWDGWTKEKGFQNPGMNSFNHYSLGSPVKWLYTHVSGIQLLEPAFKSFMIKPVLGGNLSYAKARLNTVYGEIESNWEIQNNSFILKVKIPANTTARIFMPGEVIDKGALKHSAIQQGYYIYDLGSGIYTFKSVIKK